ncbi:multiprotein-bridging factor 1 family protein [Chloroflexota bacterium]
MQQLQERIRTLRAKMGWSREQLARQIDVSLSSVQRWELYDVTPGKPAQKELNKLFKRAGINNG